MLVRTTMGTMLLEGVVYLLNWFMNFDVILHSTMKNLLSNELNEVLQNEKVLLAHFMTKLEPLLPGKRWSCLLDPCIVWYYRDQSVQDKDRTHVDGRWSALNHIISPQATKIIHPTCPG